MKNITKKGRLGLYVSGALILISAIIVIASLGVVDEVGGCGEGVKTENDVSGDGEKVAGDEGAHGKNVSIEEEEAEKKAEQEREEILSLYQPIDSNDYCADFPDFKKVGDLTQGKREIVYNQYANQGNQMVAKKAPSKKKKKPTIYEEITELALAPSSKNPLPLMGTWNAGTFFLPTAGYTPHWQIDLIEGKVDRKQHFWIPMWTVPTPNGNNVICFDSGDSCMPYQRTYFTETVKTPNGPKSALERAKEHKLPIAFIGGVYQHYLQKELYLNYPDDDNPLAIALNPNSQNSSLGRFLSKGGDRASQYEVFISPFASDIEATKKQVQYWYDVGRMWGGSEMMRLIQSSYPNPPLILFNWVNEAAELHETLVEQEKRYMKLFGSGRSDNFKRLAIEIGFRVRHCNLQRGFRDGLTEKAWRTNSKFVHYISGSYAGYAGRFAGWMQYPRYYIDNYYNEGDNYYLRSTEGSIMNHFPLYAEGEESDYFNKGCESNLYDNEVQGAVFEQMNRVSFVKEQMRINPNYWRQIQPFSGSWAQCGDMGETPIMSKERYAGFVQFGAWLTRPRVIREYVGRVDQYDVEPFTFAFINAVDRIHRNSTLKEYWMESQLVPNRYVEHPYSLLSPEYSTKDRNFLLTTDRDPADTRPNVPGTQWELTTTFDVMCMARVKGEVPKRKFLVYCYAPTGEASNVAVRVPDVDTFTLPKIKVDGSYYLIEEKTVIRNKIKTKIWRVKEVVN